MLEFGLRASEAPFSAAFQPKICFFFFPLVGVGFAGKRTQKWNKTAQKWSKKTQKWNKTTQNWAKTTPKWTKTTPKWNKTTQNVLKQPKNGLRKLENSFPHKIKTSMDFWAQILLFIYP